MPDAIDIAGMRRSYLNEGLSESDLAPDWTGQFGGWLADAVRAQLLEPNAMVLSTADGEGRPSARTVLLKGFDERGLVFFTNYASRKGRELAANPRAAVVFPWIALARQVLIGGDVQAVTRAESTDYFHSRPRGSQLGAVASPQSTVIPTRRVLTDERDRLATAYPDEVPIPEHWGGFRLRPATVEFWQGREDRLHDRLRYRRTRDDWVIERLAP